MKVGDFLEIFIEQPAIRTISRKTNGWDYRTYMGLAGLTSYLKFDCDFNEKGLCKARRDKVFRGNPKAPMCCCYNCRGCVGYIRNIPSNTEIIKFYADSFSDETGFWRKGIGCNLPREYRSQICLSYNCDHNLHRKPDSHRHLISCLSGKYGNMVIDGEKVFEDNIISEFKKWLEAEPTYSKGAGKI